MDIVYTRDVWMHRIDISRATGRKPELTAGHDGRLIADMVTDWASTHHQAFSLLLTGPAGGSYANSSDAGWPGVQGAVEKFIRYLVPVAPCRSPAQSYRAAVLQAPDSTVMRARDGHAAAAR